MKKAIVLCLAALPCLPANAQRHQVEAGAGGYRFFGIIGQLDDYINTMHLRYAWRARKDWRLYARYTRLPLNGWLLAEVNHGLAKESVNKLVSYNKYHYFDAGAQYTLYTARAHEFSASAGLSVAYGEQQYLKKVIWTEPEPWEPHGHPIEAVYDKKMKATAGLRYDYRFYAKRIHIGADFAARFYTHGFPFQVNYCVHMGYSF